MSIRASSKPPPLPSHPSSFLEPFSFQIGTGGVIKAWDEGVMTMALGEKARITASPDYAYGAGGFPAWGISASPALPCIADCTRV